MITAYWILEYIKVLLGYAFVMFVWPSVVFHRFLKGKSLSLRFSFCVTVQILVLNTLVLMLGLFHLLNPWVVRVIFWGVFLWGLIPYIRIGQEEGRAVKNLVQGNYGKKNFIISCWDKMNHTIRTNLKNFSQYMKGHWWEYIVLAIIVVFGVIYFSWGAFSDYSYGFGDMYTHSAWIYGLLQGQIFSDGVYPEAMHCFIYGLHVLFGVELYSIQLFLAGIHVTAFLLGAYILLKEIFHWKYSPMFALALFLTIDMVCVDGIFSISRLQWTLPQEFGLFTQFLCAAYLIKYLRYSKPVTRKGKLTKGYWDENLLIFLLSLAASLAIHFYATIMAVFLCIAFIPVFFRKIFSRKHFLPLAAAVSLGIVIAVVPMLGALASGIPFQGSIGWAVSVMEGTAAENQTNGLLEEEEQLQSSQENNSQIGALIDGTEHVSGTEGSIQSSDTDKDSGLSILLDKITETLKFKWDRLYRYGYKMLYESERAGWVIGITILTAGMWVIYRIAALLYNLISKKKKVPGNFMDLHISLTLSTFIYMVMYCAEAVGLPPLIAGARLCSTEQILILAMMVIPIDILFVGLSRFLPKTVMNIFSALLIGAIYLGTMAAGVFHGYLYYELTRYNSAVLTTNSIVRTLPKGTYTIVSTTDELYQMIYYGWHEEQTAFLNGKLEEDYRIPTEYVFIYVEKKPIEYAQSHFFEGPDWLATEKYTQYYASLVSQCPNITSSEITQELIDTEMTYFINRAWMYTNLWYRSLVQAKLYEWCQEFDEKYPYQLQTYYEDENFVCYYFKQNPSSPYQLGTPEGSYE